jgi:hypothetical protein
MPTPLIVDTNPIIVMVTTAHEPFVIIMDVRKGSVHWVYEVGAVTTAVTGPATQTSAVVVVSALAFVAVRVNGVVAATFTVTLPVVTGVTEPTPLSMLSAVAPVTFQASVTLPPSTGTLLGEAVKLVTVAAAGTLLAKAIPNVSTVPAATVSDGCAAGKAMLEI